MLAAAKKRSAASDPNFSSVVSLLHFDNSLADGKGNTWASTGSPAYTSGKFGQGSAISGSDESIYTNSQSLRLGNSAHTFEFQFSHDVASSRYIASSTGGAWAWNGTNGIQFFMSTDANRAIYLYFTNGSSSYVATQTGVGAFSYNTFHELAVCYDPARTDKIQMFIDGTCVAKNTSAIGSISSYSDFTLGTPQPLIDVAGVTVDEFRATTVARYGANSVTVGNQYYAPHSSPFPDA